MYRYYYSSKDEILNYFNSLETILIKTGMELDIDENIGKHYHHTIEYIGKK